MLKKDFTRFLVWIFLFSSMMLMVVYGKNSGQNTQIDQQQLHTIEKQITFLNGDTEWWQGRNHLYEYLKKVREIKSSSNQCVQVQTQISEEIDQQIKLLGPVSSGESRTLSELRVKLQKNKGIALQRITECTQVEHNAQRVILKIESLQQRLLAQHLFHRGPSLPILIYRIVPQTIHPKQLFYPKNILQKIKLSLLHHGLWLAGLALLGALITFIIGMLPKVRHIAPFLEEGNLLQSLGSATLITLKRYRFGFLLTGLWSIYWLGINSNFSNILATISWLGVGFGIAWSIITIVFNPPSGIRPILPLDDVALKHFEKTLKGLVVIAWLGGVYFLSNLKYVAAPDLSSFLHMIWIAFLAWYLIWFVWQIRPPKNRKLMGFLKGLIISILLTAWIVDWSGLYNFSSFLITGVVYSLIMLLTGWVLFLLIGDLVHGLEENRFAWSVSFKEKMGLSALSPIPGLVPINILFQAGVWFGLIFGLLMIWGFSASAQSTVLRILVAGFEIGKLHVDPLRWVIGIVIFSLLLSVRSWVNVFLSLRLKSTRLDRGARDATKAIVDYSIIILSVIVALSLAGVNFQSLAIIAGALSVGIGFGLQNIVNNFVSGLILLFERPVRAGDWISVNNIEGIVKKISIRSTQIETWDRADIIIPNSDLISQSVTNMMLHDNFGRVVVSIGVAYGSDIKLVNELLLKMANEHPQAIKNHPNVPDPSVIFTQFGDSSLNFDLRFFIRDITYKLSVMNDINTAINEKFNEHGIEIPFPQRDIHVIDVHKK